MKPFNLKEYLKNPNRKVVTRDGRNVKIICTNFDSEKYPIIGEIKGYGYPAIYDEEGYAPCSDYDNSTDLFFAPEKHEGWINLYKYESGVIGISSHYFTSKKEAEEEGKTHTCNVTTIKMEWEE